MHEPKPISGREGVLARLGRFSFRRPWPVIAVWVVLVVGLSALSAALGPTFRAQFSSIGSESDHGNAVLGKGFGRAAGGEQAQIVFRADKGVADAAVKTSMTEFFDRVAKVGGVVVGSPYAPGGERQIASRGPSAGKLAYASLSLPRGITQTRVSDIGKTIRVMRPKGFTKAQLQVEFGGDTFADFKPPSSELLGVAFAIVILILAFGSAQYGGSPAIGAPPMARARY